MYFPMSINHTTHANIKIRILYMVKFCIAHVASSTIQTKLNSSLKFIVPHSTYCLYSTKIINHEMPELSKIASVWKYCLVLSSQFILSALYLFIYSSCPIGPQSHQSSSSIFAPVIGFSSISVLIRFFPAYAKNSLDVECSFLENFIWKQS